MRRSSICANWARSTSREKRLTTTEQRSRDPDALASSFPSSPPSCSTLSAISSASVAICASRSISLCRSDAATDSSACGARGGMRA